MPGRNVAILFARNECGSWRCGGTSLFRANPVSWTKQNTRIADSASGPSVHQKTYGHGCAWTMKPPMVGLAMTPSSQLNSKHAKALKIP